MKWMLIMAKRLPDEREAIKGAGVATATAVGLLSGADLVADAGSYGIARSLAVLALEESVKARTLGAIAVAAAQGRRPGFSDDDLRKIVYSGHGERHAVGLVQHVAAAFPDLYGRVMLGMSVGAADAAKIAKLAGLLDAANTWKQAGFYSDFDPDSGSWSSPGSVTEAEFTKIRTLIGEYVKRDAASARRLHAIPCGETGRDRIVNVSASQQALRRRSTAWPATRMPSCRGPLVCRNVTRAGGKAVAVQAR